MNSVVSRLNGWVIAVSEILSLSGVGNINLK
jgi:hypothetical protein